MLSLLKRKKGKLTMVTKLRMALAVAAGMTYLHRQHVLHNVIQVPSFAALGNDYNCCATGSGRP